MCTANANHIMDCTTLSMDQSVIGYFTYGQRIRIKGYPIMYGMPDILDGALGERRPPWTRLTPYFPQSRSTRFA